jgi:hypothetical protein
LTAGQVNLHRLSWVEPIIGVHTAAQACCSHPRYSHPRHSNPRHLFVPGIPVTDQPVDLGTIHIFFGTPHSGHYGSINTVMNIGKNGHFLFPLTQSMCAGNMDVCLFVCSRVLWLYYMLAWRIQSVFAEFPTSLDPTPHPGGCIIGTRREQDWSSSLSSTPCLWWQSVIGLTTEYMDSPFEGTSWTSAQAI